MGTDKKAIILLSGGMDSAVVTALAASRGYQLYGLTFDYGQKHSRELKQAARLAADFKMMRHEILRMPLNRIAAGALVDGTAIRKTGLKPGVPSTYVNFRNGVFLAVAISFAEAVGAGRIWGGWCDADAGGYPDCRQNFLNAMEAAACQGTRAGLKSRRPFRIEAPLARLSKRQTVELGRRLGVDFGHTWTCYEPRGSHPCGLCDACRLRSMGFAQAGMEDPIK